MPEFRIHYLPIAQKDLLEILEYIRMDNPGAASDLLNKFDEAIARLGSFPQMGSAPKDLRLRHLGYRTLIIGNYLVFYVAMNDVVEIRRIIHGKRRYEFCCDIPRLGPLDPLRTYRNGRPSWPPGVEEGRSFGERGQ